MTKSPQIRIVIVAACLMLAALAINESRRQPEPAAWCDLRIMACSERLMSEVAR